ncbi:ATP-dependent DNA ligase [Myceligenerans pegani]|uniref:DNA ligase n=1 Tax=Myceligenerans pegani TaxID=2776917 RepID=A0ABR9MY17_9MICO|nr:ATP-dependent DNA ligase [Myceligenerans sp. TRM 65318]MBE1875829.1 ATP-dependent DNA ligase [Myceligenerans sp. TRM 65318]MBE3018100.1 ATP-dependent DNA ligase [Myceligenerans sp. TRM 65318]
MLLAEVVDTSEAVTATRSRLAKRAAIAECLRRGAAEAASPSADTGPDATGADELEIAVAYLSGELRQRRTGLGWATLRDLPPPAASPTLTLHDVDAALAALSRLAGAGSEAARAAATSALFAAATRREQVFLRALIIGELRQGALDSVVVDAVAEAADLPADAVRRAVMLRGATGPVASAALLSPDPLAALAGFSLEVGRPVRPMLAQSAPDVAAALDKLPSGGAPGTGGACVDVKLDGIRIQVHRADDDVRVFTRSLDDITRRVPEIVAAVRDLPEARLVLDGEAIVLGPDGAPRPFQETASRSATHEARGGADDGAAGVTTDGPGAEPAPELESVTLTPFFFDVLHAGGHDLIDTPLRDRLAVLDRIGGRHAVRRLMEPGTGPEPDAADAASGTTTTAVVGPGADEGSADATTHDTTALFTEFFEQAVREGQEGVVVKSLDSLYAAGRRGAGWIKVKPRKTLDLVVLAVEWGSGRRQGKLSNIHLGARRPNPDGTDGFVMLGKTFKGMTDRMLEWQTERFLALETSREGHVVHVRPEQVVEIAFDGLQRSTRYPGGLALRFARVLRYRDDKRASEADTIDTVRSLAG